MRVRDRLGAELAGIGLTWHRALFAAAGMFVGAWAGFILLMGLGGHS